MGHVQQEKPKEVLQEELAKTIRRTYEDLIIIQTYVSQNWSKVSPLLPEKREYYDVVLTAKTYEVMDTKVNHPYLEKWWGVRIRNKRQYLLDCIQKSNLGDKLNELKTFSGALASQVGKGEFRKEEANVLELLVKDTKHFQYQPCMPRIK